MLLSSAHHELLLNFVGVIKGLFTTHYHPEFSVSDLLFDITIKNQDNIRITLYNNTSVQPSMKSQAMTAFKKITNLLESLKIHNELTKENYFQNISLTLYKELDPSPRFDHFQSKFINEHLDIVDFQLTDTKYNQHIMLYINAPYNLYEQELKSIESKYKEFFTNNSDYNTTPLDLIITLDASEDTEPTDTTYITQYIKNKAKDLIQKIKTNIFTDELFYNDNIFHIYITSSKDPSLIRHEIISENNWLYAYAIDTQHHDVIMSEKITANHFIPFCQRLFQLQNKDERKHISQSMKKLQRLKANIQNLPYKGELKYEYRIKLIPNNNITDFEYKSLKFTSISGTLRSKEYNEIYPLENYIENKSNFKLNELKSFSFTPGKECDNCKKQFTDNDYQYYCYWCKISFCIDCIENKFKESTHIERYFHKLHNLLYFKTQKDKADLENLDKYKLGNNTFVQMQTSLGNSHSAICNGCRGHFSQRQQANPRYICVTCRPGIYQSGGFDDFCYDCIKDYRERKGRFYNLANSAPEHNEDHHVYFLIICSCGGYQEY